MATTFADWLGVMLSERDWRQRELAQHVGVSQQTASRWLSGQSIPSRAHVPGLAAALGVTVSQVLERCEDYPGIAK